MIIKKWKVEHCSNLVNSKSISKPVRKLEKLNLSTSKRVVTNFCDYMEKNSKSLRYMTTESDTKRKLKSLVTRLNTSKKTNRTTSRFLETVKDLLEEIQENTELSSAE